jgi:hypothetical protein
VGIQRYWKTGVWFVMETAEQFQLQYCLGIQRYWQTGCLVCTEISCTFTVTKMCGYAAVLTDRVLVCTGNSWTVTFTVTVLCGDTAVLKDRSFFFYWKQLNSYSYSIVWGYSGTDRQGVWFVLETAELLQLQLQYCVGIQRYWKTVRFVLYWKQLITTHVVSLNRQCVSSIIRPLLRTTNNIHITQRYQPLNDVQQYWLTDCMEQRPSGEADRFSAS